MADLPKWVWDVLADVVEYEDWHGKDERCLGSTLERVPVEVLRGAGVVRQYRGYDQGLASADAQAAPHVDREPPAWERELLDRKWREQEAGG